MEKLHKFIKNFILTVTCTFSGVWLFIFIISVILNSTIMKSAFHEKLFEKNDISIHVQSVIDTSFKSVFENFAGQSGELNAQQKEIYSIIENSTSPQMIKMNLDSLRSGIFQYFSGENNFLPNIYIDINSINQESKSSSEKSNTDEQNVSLSQIRRINLNAVLLSLNRTDILDQLLLIKLIYFVMSYLPGLSLLIIVLLYLIALVASKKHTELVMWLFRSFLISGILCLLTCIGLLVYLYRILPSNIYLLEMLIPLKSDVLTSYIKGCAVPVIILSSISGLILVVISLAVFLLNRFLPGFTSKTTFITARLPLKIKKTASYSILTLSFIFVISGLGFRFYSFNKDFSDNNFSNIISKITNTNTVTQVISAKNDTIYTLQIKLVDAKSSQPVPQIKINITGKSETPDKHYNTGGVTDENGTVKFTLGKGTFHLFFAPVSSLNNYILPSPFFYELKSVGTTILTINLDTDNDIIENSGIGEIEVLDENNIPVKGLELALVNIFKDNESPNKYYSVTNDEGISVFKLLEGDYEVEFSQKKFPEDFIIPEAFEINVSEDITTRYTIQLARKHTTSD
jgi:hypothetical protein